MGDNKKNAAHLSGGGGEKGDTRGVVSVRPRHKPPAPELHKPLQSQSIKAQSQAPDSEHAFRHIQIQPAPPEPYISGAPFMGRRHSAGGYSNALSSHLMENLLESVAHSRSRYSLASHINRIHHFDKQLSSAYYHHREDDHRKMRFWDNRTIDDLSVGRRLSYDPIPCPDKNCMFP